MLFLNNQVEQCIINSPHEGLTSWQRQAEMFKYTEESQRPQAGLTKEQENKINKECYKIKQEVKLYSFACRLNFTAQSF